MEESVHQFNSEPPLFIVGCGRSGTTLLRLMLNAHPAFAIPQESHVIYKIARLRARGGWPEEVTSDGGWNHLVDYLATTPYLEAWSFDRESLLERLAVLKERSHAAAFRTLFEAYLAQHGGTRWGDKTPQHVQYILLLDRLFPNAQFVHVVRDGRDVALSLMTRKWGPRRMELAGYYWAWFVLSGRIAGSLLGPDRYREVRFEDIVQDPEATLRDLCNWLDLSYRPELLAYHETEAAHTYAQGGVVARRLMQPPDPKRTQRWRHSMSAYDLRVFMRQAGGILPHFGYEVDDLTPGQQHVCERLEALMRPENLAAIAASGSAFSASEPLLLGRLLLERFYQGAALIRGNFPRFAMGSIRWQRTVADLLT